MLFSPGKKMAILMLLTILVLSLLLGSLREGMEDAAVQVVNKDAPSVSDPSVSNQEKPVTVDQITKILGSNQAVQQLLKK
jgi:hypothetical protein